MAVNCTVPAPAGGAIQVNEGKLLVLTLLDEWVSACENAPQPVRS
jgi:hypothetical protein